MQAEVEFEIGVYCAPVFFPLYCECWGELVEGFGGLVDLVLGPVMRLVFGFVVGGDFFDFFFFFFGQKNRLSSQQKWACGF